MAEGDCFKLLAACFYEPDKQLFEEEQVFKNLGTCMHEVEPTLSMMVEELGQSFADESQDILLLDYATLFIGPFEVLVPPYGSVFLESKRTIMGDSTMSVATCYKNAGLSVDVKDAPDHIAIELEFLSFLCHQKAIHIEDPKEYDHWGEEYHVFLQKWVYSWVPGFCQQIQSGTNNTYFRKLSILLEAYLANRCR